MVVRLALIIAGLAVVDALLSLGTRWFSSRIGEGLIFDMRTKVFEHVQRMSLAFFTRTQTGALVSRLNNDVIGAQQAFTSTLSGVVSNVIGLAITATVMFTLSWQVTALSLVLLPIFVLPAKRFGRKLQALTRESYGLNASMNTTTTERFNVSGALLVALFGRPQEEASVLPGPGREGSRHRRDDSHVRAGVHRRPEFGRSHGAGVDLRSGRHPGPERRHRNGCRCLVGTAAVPALRPADGAVECPGGRDERTGIVRTGLRGPRPATADHRETRRGGAPAGRQSVEFTDVHFAYPGADEVSLASLEDVAIPDHTPRHPVLHGVSFRAEPGQLVALVGPSGAGKTTISQLIPRVYDVDTGSVRVGGIDVRDLTLQSLRDAIGVVAQDAHLFHDSIRANLLYSRPDATEDDLIRALQAAQIWDLVSRHASGPGHRGR